MFKAHPRQSKTITGLALGVWFFALLVGLAHACSFGELGITPGERVVTSAGAGSPDDGMPVGCEQFCASDVPVVSNPPLIAGQPDAQPLIVAVTEVHVFVTSPPAFQRAPVAHSPSDVPPFLRFTRLRL